MLISCVVGSALPTVDISVPFLQLYQHWLVELFLNSLNGLSKFFKRVRLYRVLDYCSIFSQLFNRLGVFVCTIVVLTTCFDTLRSCSLRRSYARDLSVDEIMIFQLAKQTKTVLQARGCVSQKIVVLQTRALLQAAFVSTFQYDADLD